MYTNEAVARQKRAEIAKRSKLRSESEQRNLENFIVENRSYKPGSKQPERSGDQNKGGKEPKK